MSNSLEINNTRENITYYDSNNIEKTVLSNTKINVTLPLPSQNHEITVYTSLKILEKYLAMQGSSTHKRPWINPFKRITIAID